MSISIETRMEQLKYLLAVAQADKNLTIQEILAVNEFMKQFPDLEARVDFSKTVNVTDIDFSMITDEIVYHETIKLMESVAKSDGLIDSAKTKVIEDLKQRYETFKLVQGFDHLLSNYSEYELKQIASCYADGFAVEKNSNVAKAILMLVGQDAIGTLQTKPQENSIEEEPQTTVEEATAIEDKKSYNAKLSALRNKVNSSNYVN
jgi:hypothetical protein